MAATTQKEIRRAVSVSELLTKNHNTLPFDGDWLAAIGEPELTGSWIIWGNSANGKTRFALQLAKYLTRFGKVAYNSLEEGASKSMKDAFEAVGMDEVKRKLILLDQEPVEDLVVRLGKKKSPDVIFIDSFQYADLNYSSYKKLRAAFPKKLFVFVSHADGKNPAGRAAVKVKYDAFVKIWVEGYKAFPQSRFGGGMPYTIWEEGAHNYYGE